MSPFVTLFGTQYMWYDLINAFVMIPAVGAYLYPALRRLGISRTRIWIFFFFGYVVEHFGGWILPLFFRMQMLHQTQWIYSWDKPPGRFFHSVFLSYLLYTLLVCRIWRWPVGKVLDQWIVAVMMASSIGRVGCWMMTCCYGKPTDLPWPFGVHINRMPLEITRHPTQIYMLLTEAAIAVFLWWYGKRKKFDGEAFWLGVALYSVYRFFIEFLRTNPVAAFGLTHAQMFSAATFVPVAWLIGFLRDKAARSHGK